MLPLLTIDRAVTRIIRVKNCIFFLFYCLCHAHYKHTSICTVGLGNRNSQRHLLRSQFKYNMQYIYRQNQHDGEFIKLPNPFRSKPESVEPEIQKFEKSFCMHRCCVCFKIDCFEDLCACHMRMRLGWSLRQNRIDYMCIIKRVTVHEWNLAVTQNLLVQW